MEAYIFMHVKPTSVFIEAVGLDQSSPFCVAEKIPAYIAFRSEYLCVCVGMSNILPFTMTSDFAYLPTVIVFDLKEQKEEVDIYYRLTKCLCAPYIYPFNEAVLSTFSLLRQHLANLIESSH